MQKQNRKLTPANTVICTPVCMFAYVHKHAVEVKKKNQSLFHSRLDSILTIHVYNVICIKYASISQMFSVVSKCICLSVSIESCQWVGKGHIKNMKK